MSIFTKIKNKRPKRSNFDLSHEVKTSTEFGRLMPILCQEVLPSDRWKGKTEIFCRMAPMLAPIMHRVNVYTHFFFVPNRILWDHWEEFITGTPKGQDTSGNPLFYVPPTIRIPYSSSSTNKNYLKSGSLCDYLGIPVLDENVFPLNSITRNITFNALPFRAYQLIFNEYYRDENLVPEVNIHKESDGELSVDFSDVSELVKLRHRAWEKDYFTSALPWPQKGPDVFLPMADSVTAITDPSVGSNTEVYDMNGNKIDLTNAANIQVSQQGNVTVNGRPVKLVSNPSQLELSGVTNTTINELRYAERLQEFLEKDARGGTRLTEILRSHFGVVASDARLQRPEYLGGGKTNIVISEVLQQSQSTDNSNLGEMGGHGVTAGITHKFKRTFDEHGWIIGIMSIMPRTSYQQGLHKQFTRGTRYDYAWPEFAHLGEQSIQNRELFYDYLRTEVNNKDFGYAPRFAEYKFINSSVHGDMATNLDFWHLGRKFSVTPALNESFITCKSDTVTAGNQSIGLNRVFAVSDMPYDHFWIQIYHKINAKRPLPYYGTPLL